MDHTYCVIMAGGKGERFWPLSTERIPKPFLKLTGDKTLIQLTIERVRNIVPTENIFVVLGKRHLNVAKRQLGDLFDENFIVEPEGRDTAPCIGFAALPILNRDSKAIMITLPADQYIPDVGGFVKTISHGVKCAKMGDYLVTVGIKPTRPETGYGYIHAHEKFNVSDGMMCYRVKKFVEKPDVERAKAYIEEDNYFWNAGMFIWKATTVMKGIEQHMPELYNGLIKIKGALSSHNRRTIDMVYKSLPRKSIDYGLMEKADNVLMIPADFRWDDVGTWTSLLRVLELDKHGNYRKGNVICVDTQDCVVYGDDMLIGTIGVSNIVVVASKKGVLVCDGNRAQEVREIAKRLSSKK